MFVSKERPFFLSDQHGYSLRLSDAIKFRSDNNLCQKTNLWRRQSSSLTIVTYSLKNTMYNPSSFNTNWYPITVAIMLTLGKKIYL